MKADMKIAGGALEVYKLDQSSPSSCDTAALPAAGAADVSLDEAPEEEPQFHHRHGTWKTATMHIITAVIGAGVLTLPAAIAWLGWVGGILCLLLFAAITLYTSRLLAACYFMNGRRNRTYMEAVTSVFGRRGGITIACLQYINLFLAAIAFNIIGGIVVQSIACSAQNQPSGCSVIKQWQGVLIFAGGQLFLSQMPSLDEGWVASAVGAVMSFSYSCITLGLSINKVAEGNHHGSVQGRQDDDKIWGVFNSFGTIVFAYGFALILIEIQDTLADPPASWRPAGARPSRLTLAGASRFSTIATLGSVERKIEDLSTQAGAVEATEGKGAIDCAGGDWPVADLEAMGSGKVLIDDRQRWQVQEMCKAVTAAMAFITFFFVSIGIFGYLSFGDTPCGEDGNILTCFSQPRGLLIAANFMVLIHIFPAYQVFTQPVFQFLEGLIRRSKSFPPAASSRPAIVAGRCLYVCVVAVVAMCLPFFNDMIGLVGAIAFWPAAVAFPIEMYIRLYRPCKRTFYMMKAISVVCLAITTCAIIGSVQQIVANASSYQFFS